MRVTNTVKAVSLACAVAWLAGCSSPSTTPDVTDATGSGAGTGAGGANSTGANTGGGISGSGIGGSVDVANLQTVFYFDFDQFSVRSDSLADLEAHAQYLATNPAAVVRLEGHADERGTREYNMALGERRAKAVERFLAINGVDMSRVETISYGEEKPAMLGSDEGSLGQNRRVELKYTSR